MQNGLRGSADLAARHELDGLPPTTAVTVGLATHRQLHDLITLARREIPGIHVTEAGLARFLQCDPESISAFERSGKLLGGIAFLYLNSRGHDALLLDAVDLKNPRSELLARGNEEVSAIYVWALACHGRAVLGLGNVARYLKKPRFFAADYFAHPATRAGRDLLIAIGFKPISSSKPDLWCYRRPWNRVPQNIPAANFSGRSFADARH